MSKTAILFSALLLLLRSTSAEPAHVAIPQQYSPFVPPSNQNKPLFLSKRQSSCPADHVSCSDLSAPEACCPSGTNCARDQRGNIACCPANNVCTGVIGDSGPSSTNSPSASSMTGGFVGTVTVTSTAGATGGSPTTPATITGDASGGGSTVPNAYYPFVYMPTAFGNAGICSQYYTSCQTESTLCFQSLVGTNAVTVNGIAGGTTQIGNSGMLQASASSICSSLSQNACRGLQSTACAQFGTTGGTVSGFVQAGKGPRETARPIIVCVAAAGVLGMVV